MTFSSIRNSKFRKIKSFWNLNLKCSEFETVNTWYIVIRFIQEIFQKKNVWGWLIHNTLFQIPTNHTILKSISILLCCEKFLSCTGFIWAVKLHWLDNFFLYMVTDQDTVFLVYKFICTFLRNRTEKLFYLFLKKLAQINCYIFRQRTDIVLFINPSPYTTVIYIKFMSPLT